MKKVLVLQPRADDGCSWYRLTQFAKGGNLEVRFLDLSLNLEQLSQVIDEADAYIVRLSDFTAFNIFEQFDWKKINKPIFLDIDDNYEIPDPLSDMYVVFGTQEVVLGDGTYLYKDGEKGFDLKKNKQRMEKFRDVMRKVTAIIVTTFELKNYANQYNDNVVVIPNAINLDIFPEVKRISGESEIRLLWAGGSTHYPDLAEIKEPLKRLMERNLNLHFYILGVAFKGIIKDLPQDRVHSFGWVKPDGHGYRLACMDADIAICPLKTMEFNKYKSSVKYYEYSAVSVPTVAKDMPPYSDDIVDGKNGMLYSTTDEFEAKIQELIDDPVKRIEIGTNARQYIKNHRQVAEIGKDWAEFISGAIDVYNPR